ncbi:MAG: DUF3761 domain-containing protein [Gemmatimonadaceae bacterium]|nr:DUF3761 domain-containing protein [Gemmatimonadaceae bacterium]
MTSRMRTLCASGLVFGVCVLAAPSATAQGKSEKAEKAEMKAENQIHKDQMKVDKAVQKRNSQVARRSTRRRTTARARVLCEDGVWVYRTTAACANRGGLAARQGNYGTYPPASARARERANENSAVVRGIGANNVRAGAIARCNDGTYWHSTMRTNACYRHGGVASWL